MWYICVLLTSLPLSIGLSGCNALTVDGFIVVPCVAGPCQEELFFTCFKIDLSVMGRCFVSVVELVTAATLPFCFVVLLPDIAAFSRPETMALFESDSCLDFIMSVSAFINAAEISRDLVFCFSLQGFFFFSESLSRHSESSLFCAVDNSLYSEFVWHRRWTPVLPILTFPSFVVASETSIHSHSHPGCPECPRCLLQVALSLLFIFLQQVRRAAGVPLPSRSHSSFHLHHHPFSHSPSQLVGQGQNTGFLLGCIQLL